METSFLCLSCTCPPIYGSHQVLAGAGVPIQATMMSVADSDSLNSLLSNLNIDYSSGINDEKKIEKLVAQIGELSSRYSDLASRYLKLVNTKVVPTNLDLASELSSKFSSSLNSTGLQKSISDLFSEFSSDLTDCLAPSQFNAATGKFTGDYAKAIKVILQSYKGKRAEISNLNEFIKSLEQKCANFELMIKQMETEKLKIAETRARNEFFSEFESLIKEDLKKTHILQQKITESLIIIKNNQLNGEPNHIDAILDSLLTELNLQEHLKKMIEKMNSRRLKQDQEIDNLMEKLSTLEGTLVQHERDKMLHQNQKRIFDNEKQELLDKISKINGQIEEERATIQKLQIDIENRKTSHAALTKAYEMTKNSLDQLKRKDNLVRKQMGTQDSDISKLQARISEFDRQIKSLRDEVQQKTQTIIALTSDNERLVEQLKAANGLSNQVEENQKRIQTLTNNYELEISKLQGLLRSKQEEKDQFVASYSKLIKTFEATKRENGALKADNLKLREKLDKIKLQHVPSELKQELEKELDLLRSENLRLRDAYTSIELERNKWREFMELDSSKTGTLTAKIAALEAENQELRMNRNLGDGSQLAEERRKNRILESECEKLNRRVWELSDQLNKINDEQSRVAEMLRNNWSSQSIRVEDKLADRTIDSFVSPLQNKSQLPRRSESIFYEAPINNFPHQQQQTPKQKQSAEEDPDLEENKRLMEIVAQVKNDLRHSGSSPYSSVFSP